ncbi:MAG: hypothetical protein Q9219_003765 [cf. Caloplaca sp. 3 TL-2023]
MEDERDQLITRKDENSPGIKKQLARDYPWRHAMKTQIISPAITLRNPRKLLRSLLNILQIDTRFEQYKSLLGRLGMGYVEELVMDAFTADFRWFVKGNEDWRYDVKKLLQVVSNLEYTGPAVYLNVIGPGCDDDEDFFRLYVGQAWNLRDQVRQHNNPKHRRSHPSLQSHVIDSRNRPLTTIYMGTLPKIWFHEDEKRALILNILEKLGTLLFQNLPSRTFHQFGVRPIYPNVHVNVLSPLFQTQGSRPASTYVEEATSFIQQTDDEQMLDYYHRKCARNPLKTLIFERALEKRGGIPHTYDAMPEVIWTYHERSVNGGENSIEASQSKRSEPHRHRCR